MMDKWTPPDNHSEPVEQSLPAPTHRVCNGARLGKKRGEVEQLLLQGESKLRIARLLKISPHSVRAVARDLDRPGYAPLSGMIAAAPIMTPDSPRGPSIPDVLRKKAMQSVDCITEEKLKKATPQACAIVADRLLGRAETIEVRTSNLDALSQIAGQFGITPSHSASRVTLEQKITVETQHLPQTAK
jgi:hypothetical protein